MEVLGRGPPEGANEIERGRGWLGSSLGNLRKSWLGLEPSVVAEGMGRSGYVLNIS